MRWIVNISILVAALSVIYYYAYFLPEQIKTRALHENVAEQIVKSEPTNKLPTATEVFNLRSKCAALGDKILQEHEENNIFPFPPSPNQLATTGFEEVSHYDPSSNRCYVKLNATTNGLQNNYPSSVDVSLFDGQTGEELASRSYPWGSSAASLDATQEKEKSRGFVLDKYYQGPSAGFDAASAYIAKMMMEDRKE